MLLSIDILRLVLQDGYTPLYIASMYKQVQVIGVLLKAGADVNEKAGNVSDMAL